MPSITFLPTADQDYQEAVGWYEERSQRAAAGFETAVDVALRRISEAPRTWPLCNDRHHFYILRKYPFSIVYRIEGDDILVVAIAHSSRSPSYWRTRG